jgi:hypothetical protein
MNKKKLLIILGAGSSISCGMPSVKELDERMRRWGEEWKDNTKVPYGTGNDVFNPLWNCIEDYYKDNPRPHLGIQSNYEKTLGEMIALASWVTPSPFGNTLYKAVKDGSVLTRFPWDEDPTQPFYARILILDQLKYLFEKLTEFMRDRSNSLQKDSLSFLNYREIRTDCPALIR